MADDLIEVWSTNSRDYLPRRYVATEFGWPALCWDPADPLGATGKTATKQYENTAFRTEAEAIENARRNLQAGIQLAVERLKEARVAVEVATEGAAKAAEEYAALLAYEERRAEEVGRG